HYYCCSYTTSSSFVF
nr:immunoglobulin light chain junction region [Macaca mulatta]